MNLSYQFRIGFPTIKLINQCKVHTSKILSVVSGDENRAARLVFNVLPQQEHIIFATTAPRPVHEISAVGSKSILKSKIYIYELFGKDQ